MIINRIYETQSSVAVATEDFQFHIFYL